MKTIDKNTLPEVLSNPITRNLILILVSTLTIAVVLVTVGIIIYNQL